MLVQAPVLDVEQLVVDEQAQQLPVGDVDDRLPRLRVPIAGLRVGKRPGLVEAGQIGAGESGGLTLVEVSAQSEVAVGEREQRLRLSEEVQTQLALPQRPRL